MNRHDFDQMVDLVVDLLTHMDQNEVNDLRDFSPKP
jgi:hypothetical protein